MANMKDKMSLDQTEMLPPAKSIETLSLPDGRNLKDAVLALNGKPFQLRYSVPVNGRPRQTGITANNWDQLCTRIAPAMAVVKTYGGEVVPHELLLL